MFFFVFRATAVDSSFPDTCQNQVLSLFLYDGLINITKQERNTEIQPLCKSDSAARRNLRRKFFIEEKKRIQSWLQAPVEGAAEPVLPVHHVHVDLHITGKS